MHLPSAGIVAGIAHEDRDVLVYLRLCYAHHDGHGEPPAAVLGQKPHRPAALPAQREGHDIRVKAQVLGCALSPLAGLGRLAPGAVQRIGRVRATDPERLFWEIAFSRHFNLRMWNTYFRPVTQLHAIKSAMDPRRHTVPRH